MISYATKAKMRELAMIGHSFHEIADACHVSHTTAFRHTRHLTKRRYRKYSDEQKQLAVRIAKWHDWNCSEAARQTGFNLRQVQKWAREARNADAK